MYYYFFDQPFLAEKKMLLLIMDSFMKLCYFTSSVKDHQREVNGTAGAFIFSSSNGFGLIIVILLTYLAYG